LGAVKKDFIIGFLIAVFATLGGAFLYLEYFATYSIEVSLEMIRARSLLGKVLALAAIPNLFVFFVFIKKKQDNRAKGVFFATIITALITLIFKWI
jgi:heme/copper-type cytochrome/quinol oxidase subunit 4